MAFLVSATAYDAFMGRFSAPLAEVFLDAVAGSGGDGGGAGEPLGDVLDVGCGPGALTAALSRRPRVGRVTAVDPQLDFVRAVRRRSHGTAVLVGAAEALPLADDTVDTSLAQLVVPFLSDAVLGLREMARVTRPGGRVAACVWDHAGGRSPLAPFWRAVVDLDPRARTESSQVGATQGELAALAAAAGLTDVHEGIVSVEVGFDTFEEWWDPFTLGVGPAGDHVAGLDPAGVVRLEEACRRLLPAPPFTIEAAAWWVRARPRSTPV